MLVIVLTSAVLFFRRGLTPPHRVKSISMATFTSEEIDLLKSRGNEYCKRVWLGLFEGTPPNDRDPQAIRDFMVDKYERKRHYLEPSQALRNGFTPSANISAGKLPATKPITSLVQDVKPLRVNGNSNDFMTNRKIEEQNKVTDFVADFASADIFSAVNSSNNNNNNNNNNASATQVAFANFDNNPVFSNGGKFFSR